MMACWPMHSRLTRDAVAVVAVASICRTSSSTYIMQKAKPQLLCSKHALPGQKSRPSVHERASWEGSVGFVAPFRNARPWRVSWTTKSAKSIPG